jgi:hypothetical protein
MDETIGVKRSSELNDSPATGRSHSVITSGVSGLAIVDPGAIYSRVGGFGQPRTFRCRATGKTDPLAPLKTDPL